MGRRKPAKAGRGHQGQGRAEVGQAEEAQARRDQRGCGVRTPRARAPQTQTEARSDASLPSKQEILDYLRTAPAKAGKREIARAFGIKGGDRIALKALLAEMAEEGLLAGNRKGFKERGHLPPVAVLQIVARDDDGELIAEPAVWDAAEGERPRALVLARARPAGSAARPRSARATASWRADPARGHGRLRLPLRGRAHQAPAARAAAPARHLPRQGRRRRPHRPRRPQGAEGVADRGRR